MNKWKNGIISVYRRGGNVFVFPRWAKESWLRTHGTIYKYEVITIYRGSISEQVDAIKLPLALY